MIIVKCSSDRRANTNIVTADWTTEAKISFAEQKYTWCEEPTTLLLTLSLSIEINTKELVCIDFGKQISGV